MKNLALMILTVFFIVGCAENENKKLHDLKATIRTPEDNVLHVTVKKFFTSGDRVFITTNDGTKYCVSINNVLLVEESK